MFFIGVIDDIFGWKKGISQWQHFLFPLFFSVPIIIYTLLVGINQIYIPILGTIYIGFIYSWFLVPIAITATSNSFNLFAGYNGLEAGLGIIILSTISIFAFFKLNITLLIILAAWIGSLAGFIKYNKYPAKVFGGDIITLINGLFAGISAIVLQLEILIAFLIIIYIIEFIIKAKHRFSTECFGIIQKNGILKANPKGGSLIHFALNKGKFTERKLVNTFYLIQIGISVISLILFFIIYQM
jgi:UDP-N-acetylglucosamine--dolichyl-phosphate N-acetylglucosaminephosphotransferase